MKLLATAAAAALLATLAAGTTTTAAPSSTLSNRVSVLEEEVAALSSVNQGEHAAFRRTIRHLGRCVRHEEVQENACTRYWFSGGFAP